MPTIYEVDYWERVRQLNNGDPYGGYDCLAWTCSGSIAHSTQGRTLTTGTYIRKHSDEPVPDPKSPGLNLVQVAAVAKTLGVYLDVRIGSRAVTFAEYERRRLDDQGALIQVGYGPIADSRYDAGGGFRGGHGMFENRRTYDPLADGRRSGIWRFDGRLYERSLIQKAASRLVIGYLNGRPIYPAIGHVWAAFTRDVTPDYRAVVPAGGFWAYKLDAQGRILRHDWHTTGGFSATCTPPEWHAWPGGPVSLRSLVKLTSGSRKGYVIEAKFAHEV